MLLRSIVMTTAIKSALCAAVWVVAAAGVAGAQADQRVGRERPADTTDTDTGARTDADTDTDTDTDDARGPGDDDLGIEPSESLVQVRFARGSARLTDEAREHLAEVVRWMKDHPWRLMILEGHTDRVGGQQRNLQLSQLRIDAVREEMIRQGADPRRLVSAAFGEMEPATRPAASRRVVVRATVHSYEEMIQAQREPRLDRSAGTPPGQPAPPPPPPTPRDDAAAPGRPPDDRS